MEVKAGQVLLREGGIFKHYGSQEKDVLRQCRIQYSGMVARLKQAGLHPNLVNCLVLRDYHVPAGEVVSIPRERIITTDEYDQLGARVRALLATVNFSVPDDLKAAFNETFNHQNKSAVIAELMREAVERARSRQRSQVEIANILSRCEDAPVLTESAFNHAREDGRP